MSVAFPIANRQMARIIKLPLNHTLPELEGMEHALSPLYTKCGLRTSNISIPWELARDADLLN